jgi:hypothetical protein
MDSCMAERLGDAEEEESWAGMGCFKAPSKVVCTSDKGSRHERHAPGVS